MNSDALAGWRLPFSFTFEGDEVRHAVFGPENAPPLVLLHGTPFSSFEWHRIAPWLARHFRVHCHDMPGYGRSTMRAGQDVSLGIQNRVFAALLQHWGLERPDVVAHDFGGATALRAHLLDGCDYRSLTLIDPVALPPVGSPFVQHVRQHEFAFAGLPAYAHEALVTAYIKPTVHRPTEGAALRPYVEPWLGETGQGAFYRQIAQMDQRYTDEAQPLYASLRCPVQLLWGEEDGWIPIERGRSLAAMLPDCRFVSVPQCGHLMQEDAPEAIVQALAEFLPEPGALKA